MAPILFPEKLSDTLDRLSSLAKGDIRDLASKDKRDCDPTSPIKLLSRCRVRLERLRRFAKGDNRD